MKYEDYSKKAQAAIDRIAARSGKTREEVVAAYDGAARGTAVNAASLFLS